MVRRISRREFLRSSVVTTCALGCAGVAAASSTPRAAGASADGIGVLVDTTRCIGCRACVRACQARNTLPREAASTTVWEGPLQSLRYDQWTVVNAVDGSDGKPPLCVKRQCLHCLEPTCVSVCPVGALTQTPEGAVIYRPERCVGCRYCVFACPFGVPKFQWDAGTTPVIGKCQFCAQQADAGGPACVGACPTGALKVGRRSDLLFEARARIRGRPDRYVAHIYGEHEVGGTRWLYLADRPFDALGFPSTLPTIGLPRLTWMALKVLPAVVSVLAVTLGVLSAWFGRREARGDDSAHA